MKAFRTALISAALVSAALAACWSTGVLAQTTNSPGAVTSGYGSSGKKSPCDDDYIKFCGGVSKYGMRQCVLDHQPDFSSACKAQRRADAAAKVGS